MELRLVRDAFDDPAYIFELRHDRFRLLTLRMGNAASFHGVTARPKISVVAAELGKLPAERAILDGEIVCAMNGPSFPLD